MLQEGINTINSINMKANIETEIIYAITSSISIEALSKLEMPSLIAISGKMGTGKDTVYKILEVIAKMKNQTIQNNKFAKKLKEIVGVIEDTSVKEFENPSIKHTSSSLIGNTIRDTLIYIGAKIREIDPNYFINDLKNEIYISSRHNINVITDLRFKNELEAVKNEVIWRINRANILTSTDISETDLDDYPFKHIIWNNSSISDLVKDVINLLIKHNDKI